MAIIATPVLKSGNIITIFIHEHWSVSLKLWGLPQIIESGMRIISPKAQIIVNTHGEYWMEHVFPKDNNPSLPACHHLYLPTGTLL